jgi:RhtX/FptX family siderophore transporter
MIADQSISTKKKLALLTSLYLSQGLPYGFFTQAIPVIMRQKGMSLESIGLSSLLALPWALKVFWAPFVDRHFVPHYGRRRSWIIPLQLASVICLIMAGFTETSVEFTTLMSLVFLVNVISSTQDIATDGLAVEILNERERGVGNGIQVAGYRLGMILGGGTLLVLFEKAGAGAAFYSMAAILLIATLPIFLHSESSHRLSESSVQIHWSDFWSFFKTKNVWNWMVGLFFYKSGDALASQMLRPLLVDLKYTIGDIGTIMGTIGFSCGLLGSLTGGWLVGIIGRRTSLLLFSVLQTATIAMYYFLATIPNIRTEWVCLMSAVEHFCGGLATVAVFTVMMDHCSSKTAATDYTVQACVIVLSTGLFSAVSGVSAESLGYANHFIVSAVLSMVGFVAIFFGSRHV